MRRIAVIDKELCKPKKCNFLCANVCPKNRSGEDCITLDEITNFPLIDEDVCIACGICVKKCPYKAIKIVNLPSQLKEKPVHRFGKNQFVLFRLPYPVEDQVVGLIGSNGLGKTTSLLILSGQIKPNLGEPGKEFELSELTSIFRGTELQNYLEKLSKEEIRVSFKPQRVDLIPSKYSG
ncbi:ribosome biogenesis/translation initiation ATPase RLI, partial [Candidatus Woesearchaeota archaeon]